MKRGDQFMGIANPAEVEVDRFIHGIKAEPTRRRSNESVLHEAAVPSSPSIVQEGFASVAATPPIILAQDLPVPAPIALTLPHLKAIGWQWVQKPAAESLHSINSLLAYQDRDF